MSYILLAVGLGSLEIFLIILAAIIFLLIVCNLKIVPQASQTVVERLGKYRTTWNAGLHCKMPFFEKIAKTITLKEQLLDTPPQPVITKDNVTMQIDAVVFYRIFDAKLFTYGVVSPIDAIGNLTATTLRNLVGDLDLDGTLTSRDTINDQMALILDKATDPWGIKISRVEIKNIIPPKEIREAMEKQMRAERERRETLLQAEGHKAAAITRAEGDKQALVLAAEGERDAMIARAEGQAKAKLLERQAEADGLKLLKEAQIDNAVLELKRYEALIKLADGKAAKIIVPTDAVSSVRNDILFSEMTGLGQSTESAPEEPAPVKEDPCCERFAEGDGQ